MDKLYEAENEECEKELDELKNVEETEMTVMQYTVRWLYHFTWGKITAAQLTREVLVELIDRIYVYPDQQIEMYFKFAPGIDSTDRITQKDEVVCCIRWQHIVVCQRTLGRIRSVNVLQTR